MLAKQREGGRSKQTKGGGEFEEAPTSTQATDDKAMGAHKALGAPPRSDEEGSNDEKAGSGEPREDDVETKTEKQEPDKGTKALLQRAKTFSNSEGGTFSTIFSSVTQECREVLREILAHHGIQGLQRVRLAPGRQVTNVNEMVGSLVDAVEKLVLGRAPGSAEPKAGNGSAGASPSAIFHRRSKGSRRDAYLRARDEAAKTILSAVTTAMEADDVAVAGPWNLGPFVVEHVQALFNVHHDTSRGKNQAAADRDRTLVSWLVPGLKLADNTARTCVAGIEEALLALATTFDGSTAAGAAGGDAAQPMEVDEEKTSETASGAAATSLPSRSSPAPAGNPSPVGARAAGVPDREGVARVGDLDPGLMMRAVRSVLEDLVPEFSEDVAEGDAGVPANKGHGDRLQALAEWNRHSAAGDVECTPDSGPATLLRAFARWFAFQHMDVSWLLRRERTPQHLQTEKEHRQWLEGLCALLGGLQAGPGPRYPEGASEADQLAVLVRSIVITACGRGAGDSAPVPEANSAGSPAPASKDNAKPDVGAPAAQAEASIVGEDIGESDPQSQTQRRARASFPSPDKVVHLVEAWESQLRELTGSSATKKKNQQQRKDFVKAVQSQLRTTLKLRAQKPV